MARPTVRWTRTTDIQFAGILEYWVKRNKSNTYSKKLIKDVAAKTAEIAATPYIYKKADHAAIRVTSLGNYSIYYKINGEEIIVSAFWDNRQDPNKLLRILREGKNE